MLIHFFNKYPLLALFLHVILGFLAKALPEMVAITYLILTVIAALEIIATRDNAHLTAYYALYLTGFEVLSRMSRSVLFWEFGKYAVIGIFGIGTWVSTQQKNRPYALLIYFALLFPGILVSAAYAGVSEERVRDLASQYMSGPAALLAAGWYFYQRPFQQEHLGFVLRAGIMPAIALLTLLFLGKSLSEIDFVGGSNFDASGGFGPNQVSSALGWAIVLLVLGRLLGFSFSGNSWIDMVVLGLLVFRGLLTFSRGGMMGAFGALGLSMIFLYLYSGTYRLRMRAHLPKIGLSMGLLVAIALIANQLTGNFLWYRYQGKTTSEVILGRSITEGEYLSGRSEIMDSELSAFAENPLLGVGLGRGTLYREAENRTQNIASHTEFTRMLGEHGLLGLLALLSAFVFLPIRHFFQLRRDDTRLWMLVLLGISVFTLAHSGMRMALPSVAFGLAFLWILPKKDAL